MVAVVAPTGLAALNAGGQTIHSFFRFPPDLLQPAQIKVNGLRAHLFKKLEILVIDEVSMVRADVMNGIDVSLRRHRECDEPFGGCSLVLVGDLFQLPPVVEKNLEPYFKRQYGGAYFFDAPAFKKAKFVWRELRHNYRQQDRDFAEMLDRVRTGEPSDGDLMRLNGRHVSIAGAPPSDVTRLTTINAIASRTNKDALDALPGDAAEFRALMTGSLSE